MKIFLTLISVILAVFTACGQVIECSPEFPTVNDNNVKITFHADKGTAGLKGFTGDVYAHTAVILKGASNSDWTNVKADWNKNLPECKLTRVSNNTYTLEIGNIKEYYKLSDAQAEKVDKLAFVFRSADGSKEGKETGGQNIFYQIYEAGKLNISIVSPSASPFFVDANAKFTLSVAASEAATISYKIDGKELFAESEAKKSSSVEITASGSGVHTVEIEGKTGSASSTATFSYAIRHDAELATLPAGMRRGVNRLSDNTAMFVLYAPNKKSAYVVGDFSDWQITGDSEMKKSKDGKYFFCTIGNLDKNKEYGYQFIVDETIKIADPYTEKILDPDNDKYLASIYPGLSYPTGKTTGIVSTFKLNKPEYNWQAKNFKAPDSKDLIIYELLIRDFSAERTIRAVTEQLDYLENLGINAIELLPFSEFEGNDSWGYNPSFYFAADKAYGTENDYKEFIDECHKRGIAVIQDIVLNHVFESSPLVRLYWNGSNVTSDSPWFNQSAPHKAYSWGKDFNHESAETKALVDSVMSYWMTKYNVDGFRFDFTKGFTNKPTSGDEALSAYDESRVAILKRIYDKIKSIKSDAYMICEHLCANDEEKALADYGIMLWGNANYSFCQFAMGYSSGCDLGWTNATAGKGFSKPNLIAYAESHDEERMGYKCSSFGATSPTYEGRTPQVYLERLKGAAAMLLAVPGPKMIWQFGEIGYEYSINSDETGGNIKNDNRTARKKIIENPLSDSDRKSLYDFYSMMCKLRSSDAMQLGEYRMSENGLQKTVYWTSAKANLIVASNLNTAQSNVSIKFPHAGTWYELTSGNTVEIGDVNAKINIAAGKTLVYSDTQIDFSTAVGDIIPSMGASLNVYPNPCADYCKVDADCQIKEITIHSSNGRKIMTIDADDESAEFSVSGLEPGLYLLSIKTTKNTIVKKLTITK